MLLNSLKSGLKYIRKYNKNHFRKLELDNYQHSEGVYCMLIYNLKLGNHLKLTVKSA